MADSPVPGNDGNQLRDVFSDDVSPSIKAFGADMRFEMAAFRDDLMAVLTRIEGKLDSYIEAERKRAADRGAL